MSTSHSEMFVDRESNLSSSKKSVLCFELFCSSRLTLLLKDGFEMTLFRADAIFASQFKNF